MSFDVAPERIIPEQASSWDRRFHEARYEFAKQFAPAKTILDCACGVGYGTRILAGTGARRVLGIDLSQPALEFGQTNYAAPNALLCVQNAECLGIAPGLDAVVSFETLEHLQHPQAFLESVTRSLAPDGVLLVSVPNKAALQVIGERGGDVRYSPFHEREYDIHEFRALLSAYFESLEFYFQLCPDRRLLRARELARAVRKTGLIHLKRWIPQSLLLRVRRERDQIGARENEKISADYFAPKPLDPAHVPADAFVLIAVCRHPHVRNFYYHS